MKMMETNEMNFLKKPYQPQEKEISSSFMSDTSP
jgi:hypothetical protein